MGRLFWRVTKSKWGHERQQLFGTRHSGAWARNTRSEVEESLKSAKTGKASGIDGISIEIIKAAGEAGVELLWRACRAVCKDGIAPIEWRQFIIIPIWKRKGDRRECCQYRGISLLSQPSKVFARILEKRIRYIVEPQLSENQFGFRKNKGCSDAIFILRQLQEKHIEWNKPWL